MLICIPDLLSLQQTQSVRAIVDVAQWVDGNETSGAQAAAAKRNEQLPAQSHAGRQAGALVLDALFANSVFLAAALPAYVMPPLFNRYAGGQAFGAHVDNAIRFVEGRRMRADLSMTVFLTEPDEYEGGELTIETQYGAQAVKLPAGHAVLYPSTSLHLVTPVTAGARTSSFFWIQSMVRDEGARASLFDLDQTIQSLTADRGVTDAACVRLTAIYHNLVRKWAEP